MTKGHGFRLVLASASPRRSELLRNAGIAFAVHPPQVDETRHKQESPLDYAQRVARDKARAVSKQYPDAIVLGADTIVVVGRDILGKPRDAADAARMLRRLSGRPHKVVTAVALIGSNQNKFEDVRAESTKVVFNRLSAADIRDYVASGEPMDKAGAYAIQGRASRWVPKIVGDYCNVVGLPVTLVVQMMKKRGVI